MKRKLVTLSTTAMASVLAFSMSGMVFAEDAVQDLALGTSGLVMTVAADYADGELAAEDTNDNQVGYYVSESSAIDFDVYQWAKATDETLADAGKEEAEAFGSELKEVSINGIDLVCYEAVEEWDGEEFNTVTYIAEDGNNFVEVVFWLDGDDAQTAVDAMINSLKKVENAVADGVITLGTSSLTIAPEKAYKAGEITSEDTGDSQVGYYFCDDSDVDFDVYQWAKATDETLADAAAEEAAQFNAEAQETEINGITFMCYEAEEESDGQTYTTATYMTEDGDNFVEIVFWLDGDNATEEVAGILSTITK